ncbi:MAG TPA: branched-chain amino acid ABC transporter permease [Pseudolabrys sp.]|uniref:branched-chain amino acid ABC transporter permease n=1 Tax=Pseudolabrys sp. TaxID=1960880 RepID=UPI002DDDB090|nr:branched-chain amino acid ABC transporter permease [Pseudolabrys sp.]HEV2627231.1 branched-chain amino acid ABC transporter permease [Pseudolabrys sp.]
MSHAANIVISILFDGLAYAMFLFITSVGLSVTMGLMNFVNLAHGAFAMVGGYIVVSLTRSLGIDFVPALVIAAVLVGFISVPFERLLYRRLYKATDLEQVLLTIGLAFMAIATFTYFYGPIPKSVPLPHWLEGDINLGFRAFPSYRAFLIIVGAVLVTVLWYAFERTNIGARIRAAVDNRRMAESVGINVDRLFTLTFAVGSGLAALGGGFAIQLFGLTPYFAVLYLVLFLIVVATGGLGSLKGTLLAALVIGIIDTGGKYMFPQAGNFFVYLITVVVLLIKSAGFYGRE